MHSWKEKAQEKRQAQAASIPLDWQLKSIPQDFKDSRPVIELSGILSPTELKITNTIDAARICGNIRAKVWTSEAVATAFCKRAAAAQQLTGCCTELFFDKAMTDAKALDEYMDKHGHPIGPLHGLPISLKDSYEIKGQDTTLGWVGLIGQPAAGDSLSVKQLKDLGAIIYCKTNVPQSLMMSDSYNHVFGQSVNALNRQLISGGSSGGEGAIVGAHGSLLGFGTDIGGSIRIPAALQGLYGLSPTTGRISNRASSKHQEYVVPPVAGPIASCISTIEMFMDAYLSSKPWESDPQLVPVPWRKELATPPSRPLKVAFIIDDGIVHPQPPVQRAMKEMMAKFQRAGHEIIDWDVESHSHGYFDLWLRAVLADGGKKCADYCKLIGEPLIPGMLVGQPKDRLNQEQRQQLADDIWEYQRAYLQRWTDSGVDALIMPVLPWVGFTPRTWTQSGQICSFTAHWNLVNYASLAVHSGTYASKTLDQPDDAWKSYKPRKHAAPWSESDTFNHEQYDPELIDGMPVSLQVVGGRFGEEKCLMVAKVIAGFDRMSNGT